MRRNEYKKIDHETSDWDLDAGSRKWVDHGTPGRRRLRDRLKRIARKRLNREMLERNEDLT